MTNEEIHRAMKQRVGYLQVTPVFVPILGLKMVKLDSRLTERKVLQKALMKYIIKSILLNFLLIKSKIFFLYCFEKNDFLILFYFCLEKRAI